MAWEDPTELVVGQTGALSVAPIGTPVPTTPTAALNSAFVGLGYTDEDGVTLTNDPTVTDFAVWQSRNPARRELTSLTISVTAKLAQWNETTVPLALGGGTIDTPSAGVYRFTPAVAGDALDERVLVFDVRDGSKHYRYIFYRGNVSESVSSDFRRGALGLLPITFRVLAPTDDPDGPPYRMLTDDPAFVAGS
jgi:hypothetical protein